MKLKDRAAFCRWRNRRGYSQRDLAYLCQCSQQFISQLETGQETTCTEELALMFAKRLDVPWEDLFVPDTDSRVRRVTRKRSIKRVTRETTAGAA